MAGIKAGEKGLSVLLLEKNERLGTKLLMTGNGRCNITNAEEDIRKMISVYDNGKFLYSAFNTFSNQDVVNFFENCGLKTKTEDKGRVFPVSDKSKDVLECLVKNLEKNKVKVNLESTVKDIFFSKKRINKIILQGGQEVTADKFIITTGGRSYPATGSSGDAYAWLKKMGHTIVEPKPVLAPIILKDKIVEELEGSSLKDVAFELVGQKKPNSSQGDAIFTANGLSGPAIFGLSKIMNQENKDIKLKIDFQAEEDEPDKKILSLFEEQKNKQIKNTLEALLPKKIIPHILKRCGVREDKKINGISKAERQRLVKLIKNFEFEVKGLAGFDKAIVTAGGVDIKEVDPKTMRSKMIDNLFLAGEVLDVHGPTGGYNLQLAWSTGALAGSSVN